MQACEGDDQTIIPIPGQPSMKLPTEPLPDGTPCDKDRACNGDGECCAHGNKLCELSVACTKPKLLPPVASSDDCVELPPDRDPVISVALDLNDVDLRPPGV